MHADAKSALLTMWGPLALNVVLIVVGYHFTGPSLNPFISFGWFVFYQKGSAAEHLLLFWAAPFGGALAAGLTVRAWEYARRQRRRGPRPLISGPAAGAAGAKAPRRRHVAA